VVLEFSGVEPARWLRSGCLFTLRGRAASATSSKIALCEAHVLPPVEATGEAGASVVAAIYVCIRCGARGDQGLGRGHVGAERHSRPVWTMERTLEDLITR
jgi:hypothetical protein